MIIGLNQILKWALRIYGVKNTTFKMFLKTNNSMASGFLMEHDTIFSITEMTLFSISYRKLRPKEFLR